MDKSIVKGKIYAFHSELMQPYGKGLKIVDGIAGDTVSVDPEETAINGSMVGEGLALAAESGHTEQELTRSGVVPNGRLWMMGRTRYSFDSEVLGIIRRVTNYRPSVSIMVKKNTFSTFDIGICNRCCFHSSLGRKHWYLFK